MREQDFVIEAEKAAREVIEPPLSIRRGAALLYEVTIDDRLDLTVDPKAPRRGQFAFQTDLCVFEEVDDDIRIPRVVLEFKSEISTHDVITYSVKARRHKQVYPYLRYGIVIGRHSTIPNRVFRHNEALDFAVAAAAFAKLRLHEILGRVLEQEVAASRLLGEIVAGSKRAYLFRSDVALEEGAGKVR